jgi:hypothetical protein
VKALRTVRENVRALKARCQQWALHLRFSLMGVIAGVRCLSG